MSDVANQLAIKAQGVGLLTTASSGAVTFLTDYQGAIASICSMAGVLIAVIGLLVNLRYKARAHRRTD